MPLPRTMPHLQVIRRSLLAATLLLPCAASLALAQDYDRPPGEVGGDTFGQGGPVDAPDPAGLAVRIGRLEGRVRDMTGQIEELQNANRKLIEQLQKFEADVDSRTAGGGRTKRADTTDGTSPPRADADATRPSSRSSHGDAFDPDAQPNAPGTPKPLGSAASAQSDDGAPMDLSGGKLRRQESNTDTLAPTPRPPSSATRDAASGTEVATATPETPRSAYEAALGLYRDKQYEAAEKGFSAFIQKNPRNKLVADATYFLGETYAQRGRSREAAEQYLKISTDYSTSARAPDAMLHLGMSLKALGAKEQACATFSEVTKKYPDAPAYVRSGAEREAKRSQC